MCSMKDVLWLGVKLNAKMLQAVNRYLSSQKLPLLSQEHNVDIFSRLHIQGMTLHSVRYIYIHIYISICVDIHTADQIS